MSVNSTDQKPCFRAFAVAAAARTQQPVDWQPAISARRFSGDNWFDMQLLNRALDALRTRLTSRPDRTLARAARAQGQTQWEAALVVETMEPRVLFSADWLPDDSAIQATGYVQHVSHSAEWANAAELVSPASDLDAGGLSDSVARRELVVIDSHVTLTADLDQQIAANPHLQVLFIDADGDGLAQISDYLAGSSPWDAIHLLAHGRDGQLQLGDNFIDADVLARRAGEISTWRRALQPGADLLIYGCDLAASEAGVSMVSQLAGLTGADVAASNDLSGNAETGGNWTLEVTTGQIDTTAHRIGAVTKSVSGSLSLATVGPETLVNSDGTLGDQLTTLYGGGSVAMDAAGNYVIVWDDSIGENIFFQRYSANGTALGANVQVNTTTLDEHTGANIAMDAAGNFVVVWETDGADTPTSFGVYGRRFDAAGNPLSGEFLVNTSTALDQTQPSIAMAADTGAFVIAWMDQSGDGDNWGIFAQRYDASGNPQGGQFQVNSTTTDAQQYPSVAMDSDGDFVIAWDSGSTFDIYAQRYNAAGVAQGTEFLVNQTTANTQWNAAAGMDAAGNFVIAWESLQQDPDTSAGIYARRFDAAGNPLSTEFRVNTTTALNQTIPSLSVDSDGRFLVAWTDQSSGSPDIRVQYFAADGTAQGSEIIANATQPGLQSASGVALSGARAVVAWSGDGPGDNDGVFAQRLVSQDPIISFGQGTVTFVEGGSPVVIDGLATVADAGTPDYDGGQLLVDAIANGQGADRIEIQNQGTGAGQVGVSGSTVTWQGVAVGTFSGSGAPLAVTFNTNADLNAVQGVMRAITFRNIAVDPTTVDRTVRFRLSDGDGGNSNEITKTVSVTGDATLVVNTTAINVDGDMSSIDALLADRGADGRIDLHEAIAATNNTAGANTIHFDIPEPLVGGAHTISLNNALPSISDQLTVDGTSEPNFAGTPMVELNGSPLPVATNNNILNLFAGSNGSVIRGLVITGAGDDGILIYDTSNHQIVGNYIGFDVSGTATRSNLEDGIVIGGNSDGNQIGGTGPSDGNVISGNGLAGIHVNGGGPDNNAILGNLIGTSPDGTAANGNSAQGILIQGGGFATQVGNASTAGRNVIAANGESNIQIGNSDNTTIRGNLIGTDITGTVDLDGTTPNVNQRGILVFSSSGTVIGGTGTNEGNLISGNNWYGVDLVNSATNSTVVGNAIGTDITGTNALGNAQGGVAISASANNNQIGGTSASARNYISGNLGNGFYIHGATTVNNTIQGNYVGADVNGNPLGNNGFGILLIGDAADNLVGGTVPGAGNRFQANLLDGVVAESSTSRNSVLGNVFIANVEQAIDLDSNGITANDTGDGDTGANELLNYPVISSAGASGASTIVRGTLNSVASRTYRIEFFSLPPAAADPGGNGEAAVYLDAIQVVTDGSGNASFDVTLAVGTTPGDLVTATTTHVENPAQVGINDLAAYGATSELAANTVISDALPVVNLDPDNSAGSGGGNFNTVFTEGGAAVLVADADATARDDSSTNLNGLTITVTNLLNPGDETLSADTSGTAISAAFNAGTGILSLTGSDSVANYQQVLRTVQYANLSDAPDTTARIIRFVASDSESNLSLPVDTTVSITTQNDAPVNMVPAGITAIEETASSVSGLSISDLDAGAGTLSTRLQVSNGVLNLSLSGSVTVSAGAQNSGDLTISGTVADINASLASLTYTGNANLSGTAVDTLTVTTNDQGNTGLPGALQDVDLVSIDITAVDDAPTLGVNTGTLVNEGGTLVITNTMLRLDDVDTATTGRVYTVSALPSNGTIRLNAGALGLGATFTQDDIDNNRVDYVHNDSETNADSFQFTYGDATTSGLGPVTFNLTVNPVNDNDPVITSDGGGATASVNVSENTTAVTTGIATDADLPAQTLTWSIVPVGSGGAADAALFSVNPGTGALTFNSAPDFETPTDSGANNVYDVTVQVSDGTRTDAQIVSVTVTDTNEAPTGTDNTVSTAEDTPYTVATGDFGFTDGDAGDSLASVRIDTLPGAGTLTLAGAPVSAGQVIAEGAITSGDLVYTPPADANGTGLTTFTFSVQDSGGLFDAAPNTMTVDVSAVNDTPVNTVPVSATVTEETPSAVGGISINDIDDEGNNLTTRLQVTAGVLDVTPSGSASISAGANSSNDLTILGTAADINATLASLTYTGNTNVSGVNADTLTVATDDLGNTGTPGALQDTDIIQIDITAVDDAPTLGVNTGTSVNEGGTVVITNTMLRLDDADTATTGRVYTASALPSNGTIRLNAGALGLGATFTQDDIDNNRVDYVHNDSETNADSFQFTYGDATTSGLGPVTFNLTINPVNDNAPVITSDGGGASASVSVTENTALVSTVTATDADLPADTLTYQIIGGADAGLFNINGSTGVLSFQVAPDFEVVADADGNNVYELTVRVSDGTLTDNQAIQVTVTDVNESGVSIITDIDALPNQVAESAATGTPVGITALATDPDGTDIVTYSLADATGGVDDAAGRFAISSTTGVITVANGTLLDFEQNATHAITVRADSSDGSFSVQPVLIAVTDLNDTAPAITPGQVLGIAENSANGTLAGAVSVTDQDTVGSLQGWAITGGSGAPYFTIDPLTGAISVSDGLGLDFETTPMMDLQVRVSDGIQTSLTETVLVQLLDVNESPAIIAANSSVAENSPPGTLVLTLAATDPDAGDSTSFQIISANPSGVFSLDPTSGALTVSDSTPLNFESTNGPPQFVLQVAATDAGQLASTATILVSVTDVNEPPSALVLSPNNAIALGQQIVGQVQATDEDFAETFSYQLLDDAGGRFVLDGVTGVLSTVSDLNSITPSSGQFQVQVQVTDAAGNTVTQAFPVTLSAPGAESPVTGTPPPGTTPPDSVLAPAAPQPAPAASDDETGADEPSPDATREGAPVLLSPPTVAAQLTGELPLPASLAGEDSSTTTDARHRTTANRAVTVPVNTTVSVQDLSPSLLSERYGAWLLELFAIERGEMSFSLPDLAQNDERESPESLTDMLQDPYKVSAAIVGSGAVWWAARAAGIATTFLIGTPAWRAIDPVPILMRERQDDSDIDDDNTGSDKEVDIILNQ